MNDAHWMQLALNEAKLAAQEGEVPVGAVVVRDGKLLATGRNASIQTHDPSAHAEVLALRAAAQEVGNYRLDDATLYVTLEPCPMCAGALLHARVGRVVFAAADPKTGAAGSVLNLFDNPLLNHQTEVQGGVLAEPCAQELKSFFQARRTNPEPLRDDALRTPDQAFSSLAEVPQVSFFTPQTGDFAGLRMAFSCAGPHQAAHGWLLLHSAHDWRYAWRWLLPALAVQGHAVLAPDLMGFGQSDKPKKSRTHTLQAHADSLMAWLGNYQMERCTVVYEPTMAPLVKALASCYSGLSIALIELETNRLMDEAARQAPFPDMGHRAALAAVQAWSYTVCPSAEQRVKMDIDTPDAARQAAQYLFSLLPIKG